MRKSWNSTSWVWLSVFLATLPVAYGSPPPLVSLQEDGSLVIADSKGAIADFVKQGTPRQSVEIGNQNCNVSYGFNSAGKKTILISVPAAATAPVVFDLGDNRITIPAKSALRITLGANNRVEKMDGNPAETVRFETIPSALPTPATSPPPPPPSQTSPTPTPVPETPAEPQPSLPTPSSLSTPSPNLTSAPTEDGWPGKLLETPIPASQMEEEMFYARTELGIRFMSSLSLVTISGPQAGLGAYTQKQFAFGTGYRQDFDVGVQLIDWFGLSFTSGFALNSVRANTEGMTVSDGTYWTFPFMAQLCFQYPNDSGWIPYLNFGFGGAVTVLKLGNVTYALAPGANLSGTGNCVTNAYQISAGVRYRLYEDLSITLGYKFYGNSQGTVNLNNGVQLGLGSPVTNSAEVGVNLAF
jgi:opacity protein-like surface antigen